VSASKIVGVDVAAIPAAVSDDDIDAMVNVCDDCAQAYTPPQQDSDSDLLGDPSDPTPLPEPRALPGLLSGLLLLALLQRQRAR